MRPKRYPYSGKRKKPIGESIDLLVRLLRDGEVKYLYFDTVKKIADALEISIDELR